LSPNTLQYMNPAILIHRGEHGRHGTGPFEAYVVLVKHESSLGYERHTPTNVEDGRTEAREMRFCQFITP